MATVGRRLQSKMTEPLRIRPTAKTRSGTPPPGAFTGFPASGVQWFKALAMEQDRDWFQANRAGYESLWLTPMKALLAELETPLAKIYGRALGPAKIFRLNRDIRFSKDKSPYKTNIAALVPFAAGSGEGFSPMAGPAALYLHLGLEEQVAFGFYALEAAGLQRLRASVLEERTGRAVQRIVAAAQHQGLSVSSLETLKRPPPGVTSDHPRVELLKHKGIALSCGAIPANVRHSAKLKHWLLAQAQVAAPLIRWGFAQRLVG